MFFLYSGFFFIVIIILLAVLPAVLLMRYVYHRDKLEKEPASLLILVVLMGVLAAFVSMILESIGEAILGLTPLEPDSPRYTIILAFLVVAVVEEGAKYLLMHLKVWNHPAFDYRFDGIVYAVFASLGFAAMENIMYVFGYGLPVVISRALLAIPAHMSFSVVFGVFYGRARMFMNRGRRGLCGLNLLLGYLIAVFFHGFYDSCAMIGTGFSMLLFAVFMVIIYIVVFMVVKSESRTDHRI